MEFMVGGLQTSESAAATVVSATAASAPWPAGLPLLFPGTTSEAYLAVGLGQGLQAARNLAPRHALAVAAGHGHHLPHRRSGGCRLCGVARGAACRTSHDRGGVRRSNRLVYVHMARGAGAFWQKAVACELTVRSWRARMVVQNKIIGEMRASMERHGRGDVLLWAQRGGEKMSSPPSTCQCLSGAVAGEYLRNHRAVSFVRLRGLLQPKIPRSGFCPLPPATHCAQCCWPPLGFQLVPLGAGGPKIIKALQLLTSCSGMVMNLQQTIVTEKEWGRGDRMHCR